MRYPTTDQSAGHRAQKGALDFGLTKRALKFARLYAENNWTITRAAQEAGFSDRGRGAHVRGCELMRDPRVIWAILYFGVLAFSSARREAIEMLRNVGEDKREGCYWSYWDRQSIKRLRTTLDQFEPRSQRLERIYERGILYAMAPAV